MTRQWGHTERALRMFVSSPNDVAEERHMVDKIVDEVNRSLGAKLGLFIRIERWEQWHPTMMPFDQYVRDHLRDADLFVMIFNRRAGESSLTGGAGSGTLDEFSIAQELREDSKYDRPEVFVYFRKIADPELMSDQGPQLRKVMAFKRIVSKKAFYYEYRTPETFYYEFKDHLIQWMIELWQRLRVEGNLDAKRNILRRFFAVPESQEAEPAAIIVYPPIGATVVPHLLPQITMEDFHAAHKITKCLNIAGCHDVDAHTSERYDEREHRTKNIVFVCLPRNHPGRTTLDAIVERRFQFENLDDRPRRLVRWTPSSGRAFAVHSPYEKYLAAQPEAEGARAMVDFAVIARYHNVHAPGSSERRDDLSDVYISGLRGIGTWGAAWYLDRCTTDLGARLDSSTNYEALVRVEYFNNRIRKVEDVSDETKEFFEHELSPERVDELIKAYRQEGFGGDRGAVRPDSVRLVPDELDD